ncbi:hypothetical protein [Magnetococcus sp. PR-3]|uniref:hypothetical protein n=1 Tax=Magnetococcus sp. PR-3 TaxID=3120355 RepID=UPI002FCE316A
MDDLHLGFSESEDQCQTEVLSPEIFRLLELDAAQSALDAMCRMVLSDLENVEGLRSLSGIIRLKLSLFA